MSIRDWPEGERPREKLIRHGARTLSDAEVLAICIRQGTRGASAIDVARTLLEQHGGLRAVLNAPREKLCEQPGIGPNKYAEIQAVLELGRRYLAEKMMRDGPLISHAQVMNYLQLWLRDREQEVFACLFLDTRHRVLRMDEMFHGTINGATIHIREVVKKALSCNAAAVVAIHNHPSGVAEPSRADALTTRQLKEALALIDVNLLDHVIVGDGCQTSLSEFGVL